MQNLIDCCNVWSEAVFDDSEEERDKFTANVIQLALKHGFEYVEKFEKSFRKVMEEEIHG